MSCGQRCCFNVTTTIRCYNSWLVVTPGPTRCYNGVKTVLQRCSYGGFFGALFLGSFFGSLWKGLLRIALLLGKRPVHTECVSRDRALRHEQAADPSKGNVGSGPAICYNGVAAGGARLGRRVLLGVRGFRGACSGHAESGEGRHHLRQGLANFISIFGESPRQINVVVPAA